MFGKSQPIYMEIYFKRPDVYIKDKTTYFGAKGCMIKAIDGKSYFDASNMGVGNILGKNKSR